MIYAAAAPRQRTGHRSTEPNNVKQIENRGKTALERTFAKSAAEHISDAVSNNAQLD